MIAKYRPRVPILALTLDGTIARQMQGYFKNCHCDILESMQGTDAIITRAVQTAKSRGLCQNGDTIVCVHGSHEAQSGSTNLLRVLLV